MGLKSLRVVGTAEPPAARDPGVCRACKWRSELSIVERARSLGCCSSKPKVHLNKLAVRQALVSTDCHSSSPQKDTPPKT
jgi:hypothetical protein